MTPEQKIQHLILIRHEQFGDDPETIEFAKGLDASGVDDQFAALSEDYELQDATDEVREGQVETGLPCDWSRHYESKAVAAQYIDGSWVGWTYWYGGGKHGEPEGVDWIEYAYDLNCVEQERVVTFREFTKAEVAQGTEAREGGDGEAGSVHDGPVA